MFDILNGISSEFIILSGVIIILFVFIVLLIMLVSLRSKFKRLSDKFEFLINGSSETSLEGILFDYMESVHAVVKKNKELESKINEMERSMMLCIQKVGVVRYNAFDDVGSDLSFAVALLDNNDDGIVLNGIYSRDSSVVYAKALLAGKSKHVLSAEEMQAIDRAQKSLRDRHNFGGRQNEGK